MSAIVLKLYENLTRGRVMRQGGIFTPIVIIALAVLSAVATIVVKRTDHAGICYAAMGFAAIVIVGVFVVYIGVLWKKDHLAMTEAYATAVLMHGAKDKKRFFVTTNESSKLSFGQKKKTEEGER